MPGRYTEAEPARSARVIIDMQRDFAEPGGQAMRAVPEAYRRAGLTIVHVVRLYLANAANIGAAAPSSVEWAKRLAGVHQ